MRYFLTLGFEGETVRQRTVNAVEGRPFDEEKNSAEEKVSQLKSEAEEIAKEITGALRRHIPSWVLENVEIDFKTKRGDREEPRIIWYGSVDVTEELDFKSEEMLRSIIAEAVDKIIDARKLVVLKLHTKVFIKRREAREMLSSNEPDSEVRARPSWLAGGIGPLLVLGIAQVILLFALCMLAVVLVAKCDRHTGVPHFECCNEWSVTQVDFSQRELSAPILVNSRTGRTWILDWTEETGYHWKSIVGESGPR